MYYNTVTPRCHAPSISSVWVIWKNLQRQFTPKSIINFFLLTVALFIHHDCFDVNCRAFETTVLEMSAFSPIWWKYLVCGARSTKKTNIWKTSPMMSPSRNLDLATQDNPQTLLWAVCCGNYFLSTRLHSRTVCECSPAERNCSDKKLMLLTTRCNINVWLHCNVSWLTVSYLIIQESMHVPFCALVRSLPAEKKTWMKLLKTRSVSYLE